MYYLILAQEQLLKCFPTSCIQLDIGQDKPGKFTPSIVIINNNEIYIVRTHCEDETISWEEIRLKAIEYFANENSILIHTECGKLTWTTKEKTSRNP